MKYFNSNHVVAGTLLAILSGSWLNAQSRPATSQFSDAKGPYTTDQLNSIKFPDLDGDGFSDMCFIDADGVQCAQFNPGTGTFGAFSLWTNQFKLGMDESFLGTVQYGDVDGDGMDDLCGRTSSGFVCLFSTGFVHWVDLNLTGPMFVPNNQKATAFGGSGFASPSNWQTIRLVDVNHDGKLDVCGRASNGIICQLVMVNSTCNSGFPGCGLIYGTPVSEIGAYTDGQGWANDPSYWTTIQFPDINGDGLPDVCGRASDGVWCALNNGSTFDSFSHWDYDFTDANGWKLPEYYTTIRFADINGDGRADLCGRGSGGYICGLSGIARDSYGYGDRFVGTTAQPAAPDFSNAKGWDQTYRYGNVWLLDMNGDHKADLCGRAYNGIVCAFSNATTATAAAAPAFATSKLVINDFVDAVEGLYYKVGETQYQWMFQVQYSVVYWSTIQPVKHGISKAPTFCGRQSDGIHCGF